MRYNLNNKRFKLLFLFSAFLFIFNCNPEGGEYVSDYDLVYTNYSPEYDFNKTYTYSLPEGVIKIDGEDDDDPEFIDKVYSDAILSNLKTNLDAMNWTEVDASDSPDIVIVASAFDQSFYYYFPPPGYPGWGWWYPGYIPGYVSGYKTGSILIQMTVPKDATNNEIPVNWICGVNGLLQGSTAYVIDRIDRNLNQAFKQAPFNN
ncbi:DUF4136 domain-containing protein [Algibacter mikhailovii]|uniref:DUF4136 domain-containing protein n=1 Tax=Algibacter mikhailovii TaxID=425498 RepID=A0A918QZ73_9FLAO|nr:DUF4136 domain-containing protein [Algibacter mikhailovii]GGZ75244.1 hypothetical protein GCM10007028_10910 [Algibacter mikhailovii]